MRKVEAPATRERQQEADHDNCNDDYDSDLYELIGGRRQRQLLEQPVEQYNYNYEHGEPDKNIHEALLGLLT
jgi:hypothetical protein